MNHKKIAILIFTLFIASKIYSQQPTDSVKSVKNISVELLGNGYFYSFKYENAFNKNRNYRYSFGASYYPTLRQLLLLPEISYLKGQTKNKLELGGGVNFLFQYIDIEGINRNLDIVIYLNLRVGYRYEGEKNIFKVAFIPLWGGVVFGAKHTDISNNMLPWIGISYGRKF